jgi:Methyltransferase domain
MEAYFKTPYTIWDFVPASYSCPYEMERIGRMGDGGKWVCGMSLYEAIPAEKPCIIYSFGVQFESSFGRLREL